MIEGIAKGFCDFLANQQYVTFSALSKDKIWEAIRLGVRDSFDSKTIVEHQPKYRKYEYCESIQCEYLEKLKAGNKEHCKSMCGAYRFHDYLQKEGYSLVKTG